MALGRSELFDYQCNNADEYGCINLAATKNLNLEWNGPRTGHFKQRCPAEMCVYSWVGKGGKKKDMYKYVTLQWRHNGHDDVSNHQPHDCVLSRLFRRRPKKTSKLRVTALCAGNSTEAGEFPAQMASSAENVSIWWRHHEPALWLLKSWHRAATFTGTVTKTNVETERPYFFHLRSDFSVIPELNQPHMPLV